MGIRTLLFQDFIPSFRDTTRSLELDELAFGRAMQRKKGEMLSQEEEDRTLP